MSKKKEADISHFFVTGINYKKAQTELRGSFTIDENGYSLLIQNAAAYNISNFFVVSTCNRTEIFGLAESAEVFSNFLCSVTKGSKASFDSISYSYSGTAAIEHFFRVATGLDSQILGDYEIVGQIKQAFKRSKANGFINNYLERLCNEVFACAKNVRTFTAFSSGTVSVSFAAIQYIRSLCGEAAGKNILLIGTGKIGVNTGKNIRHYFPESTLNILNRTDEKAMQFASEQNALFVPFRNKTDALNKADIIIVATQASEPILSSQDFLKSPGKKILIDLSVPANIDCNVLQLQNFTLIGVDGLAKVNDETLQKRRLEIPKVEALILQHKAAFLEWIQNRKYAAKLEIVKNHLHAMDHSTTTTLSTNSAAHIQKTVNNMAVKLKVENKAGCYYLQALQDFMSTN